MPTTDLPQTDSELGTAGFKFFPNGSTDRPEQVHALNYPAHLIPGGGFEAGDHKFRARSRSVDGSNVETFTIGGSTGVEEATLRIRFDGWPESLLDMASDAADGVEIRYYPRLESTNLKFPMELLGVEDVAPVSADQDRHADAEYMADWRVKDNSTDSQGFWWLKGPNKLRNSRLARGTTDGIAEEWTLSGSASNADIEDRAQKLTLSSTQGTRIEVTQTAEGAVPGDVWEFEAEVRASSLSDASPRIVVEDTTGGQAVTSFTSTRFTRVTATSTAFGTSAVDVTVRARVNDTSTGSSGTGTAWFRDAQLTLQ